MLLRSMVIQDLPQPCLQLLTYYSDIPLSLQNALGFSLLAPQTVSHPAHSAGTFPTIFCLHWSSSPAIIFFCENSSCPLRPSTLYWTRTLTPVLLYVNSQDISPCQIWNSRKNSCFLYFLFIPYLPSVPINCSYYV